MQGRGQLSAVIQAMLDYQEIKKAIIEKVLDVFLREAKITQKNASPSVPFSWLLLLLFFYFFFLLFLLSCRVWAVKLPVYKASVCSVQT